MLYLQCRNGARTDQIAKQQECGAGRMSQGTQSSTSSAGVLKLSVGFSDWCTDGVRERISKHCQQFKKMTVSGVCAYIDKKGSPVEVRKSDIEGVGLFYVLKKSAEAGTPVAVLSHGVVTDTPCSDDRRGSVLVGRNQYQQWSRYKEGMRGARMGGAANQGRDMESCNAHIKKVLMKPSGNRSKKAAVCTVIISTRTIRENEEITVWYGGSYFSE